MTTLFDSTATVKPATFARGVLRSLPTYRADHTAADEAWFVANVAATSVEPTDADFDRIADEAAWLDRYTAGNGGL